MRVFVFIAINFLFFQAYSQQVKKEFGRILVEELKLKNYKKDPSEKAVILYDKGLSVFYNTDTGYKIRFTRHKRIKIFDNSVAEHAEISIPFYEDGYGRSEVVISIKAITYNYMNGRIIKKTLDPSTIYVEKISERWSNKKFVFPDVQDGSILEFKYVLETPFKFNLPDWYFQSNIPTIYSEYEVRMIPYYEYVYLVQGISKFDYQNSELANKSGGKGYSYTPGRGIEYQDYIHTYALKDIPAFKDESFISTPNDYIVKMDFQLAKYATIDGSYKDFISTWPKLNESILKHEKFGKYKKNCSRFAKTILKSELDIIGLSPKLQSKKIIEYVKNNFEWNGYNSKYASQSAKDFFQKKKGNSADINLFLIALLNNAGIDTQPVILSTRNHGKIPIDYPYDHFTNYVIPLVNLEPHFLSDGTEKLLPYNRLPLRCFNKKGLVVHKEEAVKWVNLENTISSVEKNTIILALDTVSLNVNVQVLVQDTEYESFSNRKKFKNDTLKIKEYYSKKIGDIYKTLSVGYQSSSSSYSMRLEGTYETEKLGNYVVIKPFLELPLSKNKLTLPKRNYPIDFVYPWSREFESTLKIPTGFIIESLPEPFNISNELADINFDSSLEGNLLKVKGKYIFKKAIYSPGEYSRIKYYFNQIVKNFNQTVVLEIK